MDKVELDNLHGVVFAGINWIVVVDGIEVHACDADLFLNGKRLKGVQWVRSSPFMHGALSVRDTPFHRSQLGNKGWLRLEYNHPWTGYLIRGVDIGWCEFGEPMSDFSPRNFRMEFTIVPEVSSAVATVLCCEGKTNAVAT